MAGTAKDKGAKGNGKIFGSTTSAEIAEIFIGGLAPCANFGV